MQRWQGTRRQVLTTLGLAATAVLVVPALTGCRADGKLVTADLPRKQVSPKRSEAAAESIAAVGLDLVRASAGNENFICSSLSIVTAFGMVRNGAVGTTAEEMDQTLHLPGLADLNAGLNAIDASLAAINAAHADDDGGKKRRLRVALGNAVWGQQDVTWEQPFLDTLAADYGTGVWETDFGADPEAARQAVNAWVADRTEDKITDLMPDGSVSAFTKMVLANALYLKAPWASEMTSVSDTPFTGPNGTSDVPMITDILRRSVLTGPGWTAIRVPFRGLELAITLIQPSTDLAALLKHFRGADLMSLLATEPSVDARLTMPTCTFRTTLDLKRVLSQLGMPTAFDENRADFSDLSTDVGLFLSSAVHQGYIAVDRVGVEAAAATAISADSSSAQAPPPLEVLLDRPYLFCIHAVDPAIPLFVGVVNDPATITD